VSALPARTTADGSQDTLEHHERTLAGASGSVVAKVVDTRGEGPPFVFLHGLVGLNDHWEDVVHKVRHRRRCVMLEIPLLKLRGDDCSIDGATRLTARFLEDYLDEPGVLVGSSFGGHVALRCALEHPELVCGLVLAGSSGLIEKTMVSDVQLRPSRDWLVRKIGELFHDPDTHMRDSDVDRAHKELSERSGARAMIRLSRSARRNHLGERIGDVSVPTLLIWGREDIVTPPEAAHGFHKMIPDATLVWFEPCGHDPLIEQPDQFARALLDFDDELTRRARNSQVDSGE